MYLQGLSACQVINVAPESLLQLSATVLRPCHCTQHRKQTFRVVLVLDILQVVAHIVGTTQHGGGVQSVLHLWPSLPKGWKTREYASFHTSFHAKDIQCVLRCGMRGMTHIPRAPPQPAGRSAGRIRRCTSGESGRCYPHTSPPAGSWTQTRPATTTRPSFSMGCALPPMLVPHP